MTQEIVTQNALLDDVLEIHREVLGENRPGYRSHAYRVLNFGLALSADEPSRADKLAVAASFHDLALFPDGHLDYLGPSEEMAREHLERIGKSEWAAEVGRMIAWHHKITSYRAESTNLVEAVRRADWIDVSFSALTFGLDRGFVRDVRAAFPLHGLWPGVMGKMICRWAIRHPLNPFPIFRL